MTNNWVDIKNADLVLVMGGNAAEAHPCGFKWVTEAMQQRKAKLVVVDPRFTRSAAVADLYAPRYIRSIGLGCVFGMGIFLASQPPHPLQPRFGGRRWQTLGQLAKLYAMGWHTLDRRGRSRYARRCSAC